MPRDVLSREARGAPDDQIERLGGRCHLCELYESREGALEKAAASKQKPWRGGGQVFGFDGD